MRDTDEGVLERACRTGRLSDILILLPHCLSFMKMNITRKAGIREQSLRLVRIQNILQFVEGLHYS
ncbi:MAG: hypothetical protein U0T81_18130 [Saprospiraceae bacterium]